MRKSLFLTSLSLLITSHWVAAQVMPEDVAKPSLNQPTYTYLANYDLKASRLWSSQWSSNGSPKTDETGFRVGDSVGGAYILVHEIPEDVYQYEVAATLNFVASGGDYVLYLEASPDALLGPSSKGSFYAFALRNPTFSPHGCFATATLYKAVTGMVSEIASAGIPCSSENTYHAAFSNDNSIRLWADSTEYLKWSDGNPLRGAAGIGGANMPAGNSIASVQLGRSAQHAPQPAQPLNATLSRSLSEIGVSVGAFLDDAGPGIAHYHWYRNGAYLSSTLLPRIIDHNASDGSKYVYAVQAEDFHGNLSPMVGVADSVSESLSVRQFTSTACPLGQLYDEDNFSPVDGSGPTVPPIICVLPGEYDAPQSPPSSDNPPRPICTIEAHFRHINTTGGALAGHGYLTVYRNDTHQTLIVEGYTPDGNLLKAWDSPVGLEADNPSADQIVGRVPTSVVACTYDPTILRPAIAAINNAKISYSIFGPNSNSVWRYLISKLPGFQGTAGFPPFAAVGYSSKLPGVE